MSQGNIVGNTHEDILPIQPTSYAVATAQGKTSTLAFNAISPLWETVSALINIDATTEGINPNYVKKVRGVSEPTDALEAESFLSQLAQAGYIDKGNNNCINRDSLAQLHQKESPVTKYDSIISPTSIDDILAGGPTYPEYIICPGFYIDNGTIIQNKGTQRIFQRNV